MQNLPAVWLKQYILHAEGHRAHANGNQASNSAAAGDKGFPCLSKRRLTLLDGALARVAPLLLPGGERVKNDGNNGATLNNLHEPQGTEFRQRKAEDKGARDHAKQKHDIHETNNLWPRLLRREIRGKGQPHRLHRVQTGANKQKRHARADMPNP